MRGRAPHPCENKKARSRVRGEWGRSARARDPGEFARAWHAQRAGDSLEKFAKAPSCEARYSDVTIEANGPVRGWFVRPKRRIPTPPNASSPGDPADCRARRVPETRAGTHLRVVPPAPRTAPGRASPDASATRSLGAAPPVPRPHRTLTARTCARAPRRAHPRFRPWFRVLIFQPRFTEYRRDRSRDQRLDNSEELSGEHESYTDDACVRRVKGQAARGRGRKAWRSRRFPSHFRQPTFGAKNCILFTHMYFRQPSFDFFLQLRLEAVLTRGACATRRRVPTLRHNEEEENKTSSYVHPPPFTPGRVSLRTRGQQGRFRGRVRR